MPTFPESGLTCDRCGLICPPDASYCSGCGGRLNRSRTCASCQFLIRDSHARFCERCGSVQESEAATPAASYTPPHLVDQVLRSNRSVRGGIARVTIVFLDVVDSLRLSREVGPEPWHEIINGLFELLSPIVHTRGGTINQYTGDGIMALFGAPVARESHALRACLAALEIMHRVRDHAGDVRTRHGIELAVRMGIHTGRVVIGTIGDALRMDYTAQGEEVAVASRLESLAGANEALISEETAAEVEHYIELEDAGERRFKGVDLPVKVYRLVRTMGVRTRLDRSRARGFCPFVGRQHELEQLAESWSAAALGRGSSTIIVGSAGVGKSRLLREFIARTEISKESVVLVQCPVQNATNPYFAIAQMLRTLLTPCDDLWGKDRAAQIAECAAQVGLTDAGVALITEVLGLSGAVGIRSSRVRPSRVEELLFTCVLHVIHVRARNSPLVLAVDDAHWLDPESARMLRSVLQRTHDLSVFFVATTRPSMENSWWFRQAERLLPLDAHSETEAEAHVQHLLGTHPSVSQVTSWIYARSQGNAFFAEELVRSLREREVLTGPEGDLRCTASPGAIDIPTTIEDVIAARIGARSMGAQRLLQTTAAIGPGVTMEILQAVLGLHEELIHPALEELREADLLQLDREPSGDVTISAHPLVQEVAYGSMLRDRKREIHALISSAYTSLSPEFIERDPETLARHAELGECWRVASRCLELSGRRASRRGTNRRAVELFDRAIVAHAKSDTHPSLRATRDIALRLQLIQSLVASGSISRVEKELQEFQDEGRSLTTEQRVVILTDQLYVQWARGDYASALETGTKALSLIKPVEKPTLQIATLFALGRAHYGLGDFPAALECLTEAMQRLEANQLTGAHLGWPGYPVILISAFMAQSHAELGDFARAEELASSAIQEARQRSDQLGHLLAVAAMARTRALQSKYPEIKELILTYGSQATSSEALHLKALISIELAVALLRMHEISEGEETLKRAQTIAESIELPEHTAIRLRLALVEAQHVRKDYTAACQVARAIYERARFGGDQPAALDALLIEARSLHALGGASVELAHERVREAMELAVVAQLPARYLRARETLWSLRGRDSVEACKPETLSKSS